MCPGCKFWTALQVLWSTVYVTCGAAQLVAGVFFMISIPELQLTSNLWAGSWNVIIGIICGILACFGQLSPRRQEFLLYLAVSVLMVNCVHIILSEWGLYHADMPKVIQQHPNHVLIDYACFATRIATATVVLVGFLDSQFSYCSIQIIKSPQDKKKLRGSHEQVSDIEYIIPRAKPPKPHTVYDAYSQSWVFDTDTAGTSNHTEPYIKVVQNGTPKGRSKKSNGAQNGILTDTTHLIDNPVVHIEEASDDSTSNSDRKLCHMKSFSRATSPVVLSASSSQISLNQPINNPPIYECLEKLTEPTIYRSRLNTALSNKDEDDDDEQHYHPPQAIMMRRVESVSPHAEKVQYASLMKELQRAIVSKKEPSVISPQSTSGSVTTSDKTQTNSKSSSRHESSRSEAKSSDTEFSKELEAALQLIQDLESPNTIETPSEPKSSLDGKDTRPLAVWRNSDASGSEKTLSAVGSLGEITSPLNECQPELYTFKPHPNGKGASVIVHYPDSQSTSGYSSPTHASNGNTPNWSTTSSINGSNNDIVRPLSYSIHNAKSTTVISLYTPNSLQSKGKSVTLVTIAGDNSPVSLKQVEPVHSSTLIGEYEATANKHISSNNTDTHSNHNGQRHNLPKRSLSSVSQSGVWNVKSLLRKKKATVPKLCPELEGAIIKSESLAYLTELELLARHQRNKKIQREIEERVIQQLGTPRTESNC